MIKVIAVSVISAAVIYTVFRFLIEKEHEILKSRRMSDVFMCIAAFIALALRIAISVRYRGNIYDVECFSRWATKAYEYGFEPFYKSGFADYPPGYIYVLYVIGWLKSIFGFSPTLIKIPPMLIDIVCSMFVYKVASEKFSATVSAVIGCLYMFSPAVMFNSAMWGQVDVVHTTLVAVAIYLVLKNKTLYSYYVFAVAVITKPQSLIFTPVFMIAFYEECLATPDKRKIIRNICHGCGALLVIILLSLPFGLRETASQYISTLKSYPYATVNAYNIYGIFRLNWLEVTPAVSLMAGVFLVFTVLYVFYCYHRGNKNLFFLAGVIMFMTFMLSVKMHERYAYPSMLMFLMAYIYDRRSEVRNMFLLTTFSQLINTLYILTVTGAEATGLQKGMFMTVFSVVNVLILLYMFYVCNKMKNSMDNKC